MKKSFAALFAVILLITVSGAAASGASGEKAKTNPLDTEKEILYYLFWTVDDKLEKDLQDMQTSLDLSDEQMNSLKNLGLTEHQNNSLLKSAYSGNTRASIASFNSRVESAAVDRNKTIELILGDKYAEFRSWIASWWEAERKYRMNPASYDVNSTASHWYDEAMNYCMEASLFNGIPEEIITPDTRVTWAIIAQVLANRTANYREEYYQNQINTEDGQNNSWYAPALKWMDEMGMSDVNESPESQISRESAVRLLFEYAYKTENETDYSITNSSSHFKDKAIISETAKSAVYWAEEHGIIHGYLDSSFRPDQQILFSEMAQMLYNAKDFLSKNNITVLFSYSVSDIEKIEFQNGNTGELKSYTNKTELNDIIEHLNEFRFDSLESAGDGWTYAIRIWFREESGMRRITLSPSSVCVGGNRYISSSGHDYFPQEWIKQYCP